MPGQDSSPDAAAQADALEADGPRTRFAPAAGPAGGAPAAPSPPTAPWVPILVLLAAVGVLIALSTGRLDPGSARDGLRGLGPWAAPVFLLLFAAATCALLPTSPLSVAAGYLFGPWAGAALAWGGAFAGGMAAYGVGRKARGPVRAWLERRMARAAHALDQHPLAAVLAARLLLVPHGAASYGFGLAGAPVRPYTLGTALGLAPLAIAFAVAGEGVASAFDLPPAAWLAGLGAIALALAGAWAGAKWARGAPA